MRSVLLRTPLTANTGYGNDGFSLARSLHEAGYDVHLNPMYVAPPIPMNVAKLMVKTPLSEFDFFIHHADPIQLGLSPADQRLRAKKIAWSMWEFTGMAPDVADGLSERLSTYDMLLVYDEVSAQAFQPFVEEAGIEMKILQGGYWAEDWEWDIRERDWNTEEFNFCIVGALNQRKNPFALVKAFEEVHEEFPHARLHMKTNVMTLHPAMEERYPGLKIHYDIWPHERLKEFYSKMHCYVAPSWGEGKNLPALEAQTMGIPVIYSDFGGHRQWADSTIGWPVSGTIEEHVPGMGSIRVDHDALVAAMKAAISDREATKRKGELASRMIPSQCDWSVVVRRLGDMIR